MHKGTICNVAPRGFSLVGFLFVITIVALLAVLGMKVVPTVVEYAAIKRAIATAKNTGGSPKEIQESFEKQRTTAYIDSVTAKDLDITRTGDGFEVSIAYQKKIELVGPASLVLDYEATTGAGAVKKNLQ
jgi:Tfp pilus assembly major pilin PilA